IYSGNKVPLFSRPKRPRCVNGSEPCSSECELPCRCDHTLAQAPGVIRATDFKIPAAVSIQHRKQCQLILLADGLINSLSGKRRMISGGQQKLMITLCISGVINVEHQSIFQHWL